MDSDWTPDSSPAAQRWRGTPFLPGDRMPTATEMNALLAAAEARGRAEGWAEALRAFFQRAIADTMKEQRGE